VHSNAEQTPNYPVKEKKTRKKFLNEMKTEKEK